MHKDKRQQQKQDLKTLSQSLFQELKAEEHITLSFSGEESLFLRINHAKVRQVSEVNQGLLSLDFISERRHTECTFSLTTDQ